MLKIGVLGKTCKVFLGGFMLVAVVFQFQVSDARLHAMVRIVIHIVKERIKMLPEQLPQTVVRHTLMEQCADHVAHVGMVRQNDGYLAVLWNKPALCTCFLSL